MFKAIILWLLGATFEVRVISLKTGKKIPGRCMYKGGYWQARRVFKRLRLKNRHLSKLQAVTVLVERQNIRFDLTTAQAAANKIANQRLDNIKTALGTTEMGLPGVDDLDELLPIPPHPDTVAAARQVHDIGESNARQSEFMHKHQDEPNFDGPEADDVGPVELRDSEHLCDNDGPLEWDTAALDYCRTCSVCGELENVADSADLAQ